MALCLPRHPPVAHRPSGTTPGTSRGAPAAHPTCRTYPGAGRPKARAGAKRSTRSVQASAGLSALPGQATRIAHALHTSAKKQVSRSANACGEGTTSSSPQLCDDIRVPDAEVRLAVHALAIADHQHLWGSMLHTITLRDRVGNIAVSDQIEVEGDMCRIICGGPRTLQTRHRCTAYVATRAVFEDQYGCFR